MKSATRNWRPAWATPRSSGPRTVLPKYRKEHADLAPLVQAFRRYQQVQKELADNQGLLKDEADEELKDLAREEIQTLKEQAARLEEELRFLLLPKDPNDEKNVLLEIRAGTGGEEAGLFAADLFRMYSRLAERRGWKVEVLSHSTTGIGGLKEIIACHLRRPGLQPAEI